MKTQWKRRLALVLAVLLGFSTGLGGGTSFSLNPLKSGSVAGYPVVEAADEVSEETADATESDEPSDEEDASIEEESEEDIDEAGDEEDLSSFDAEEEEVVEETEEADEADPSFSDSEDTSDTTETEAVEEEAEEEEEEVWDPEAEEEEETEEADSETEEVVEKAEEADSLNATELSASNIKSVTATISGNAWPDQVFVGDIVNVDFAVTNITLTNNEELTLLNVSNAGLGIEEGNLTLTGFQTYNPEDSEHNDDYVPLKYDETSGYLKGTFQFKAISETSDGCIGKAGREFVGLGLSYEDDNYVINSADFTGVTFSNEISGVTISADTLDNNSDKSYIQLSDGDDVEDDSDIVFGDENTMKVVAEKKNDTTGSASFAKIELAYVPSGDGTVADLTMPTTTYWVKLENGVATWDSIELTPVNAGNGTLKATVTLFTSSGDNTSWEIGTQPAETLTRTSAPLIITKAVTIKNAVDTVTIKTINGTNMAQDEATGIFWADTSLSEKGELTADIVLNATGNSKLFASTPFDLSLVSKANANLTGVTITPKAVTNSDGESSYNSTSKTYTIVADVTATTAINADTVKLVAQPKKLDATANLGGTTASKGSKIGVYKNPLKATGAEITIDSAMADGSVPAGSYAEATAKFPADFMDPLEGETDPANKPASVYVQFTWGAESGKIVTTASAGTDNEVVVSDGYVEAELKDADKANPYYEATVALNAKNINEATTEKKLTAVAQGYSVDSKAGEWEQNLYGYSQTVEKAANVGVPTLKSFEFKTLNTQNQKVFTVPSGETSVTKVETEIDATGANLTNEKIVVKYTWKGKENVSVYEYKNITGTDVVESDARTLAKDDYFYAIAEAGGNHTYTTSATLITSEAEKNAYFEAEAFVVENTVTTEAGMNEKNADRRASTEKFDVVLNPVASIEIAAYPSRIKTSQKVEKTATVTLNPGYNPTSTSINEWTSVTVTPTWGNTGEIGSAVASSTDPVWTPYTEGGVAIENDDNETVASYYVGTFVGDVTAAAESTTGVGTISLEASTGTSGEYEITKSANMTVSATADLSISFGDLNSDDVSIVAGDEGDEENRTELALSVVPASEDIASAMAGKYVKISLKYDGNDLNLKIYNEEGENALGNSIVIPYTAAMGESGCATTLYLEGLTADSEGGTLSAVAEVFSDERCKTGVETIGITEATSENSIKVIENPITKVEVKSGIASGSEATGLIINTSEYDYPNTSAEAEAEITLADAEKFATNGEYDRIVVEWKSSKAADGESNAIGFASNTDSTGEYEIVLTPSNLASYNATLSSNVLKVPMTIFGVNPTAEDENNATITVRATAYKGDENTATNRVSARIKKTSTPGFAVRRQYLYGVYEVAAESTQLNVDGPDTTVTAYIDGDKSIIDEALTSGNKLQVTWGVSGLGADLAYVVNNEDVKSDGTSPTTNATWDSTMGMYKTSIKVRGIASGASPAGHIGITAKMIQNSGADLSYDVTAVSSKTYADEQAQNPTPSRLTNATISVDAAVKSIVFSNKSDLEKGITKNGEKTANVSLALNTLSSYYWDYAHIQYTYGSNDASNQAKLSYEGTMGKALDNTSDGHVLDVYIPTGNFSRTNNTMTLSDTIKIVGKNSSIDADGKKLTATVKLGKFADGATSVDDITSATGSSDNDSSSYTMSASDKPTIPVNGDLEFKEISVVANGAEISTNTAPDTFKNYNVAVGDTVTFKATFTPADGADMSGVSVKWDVVDNSGNSLDTDEEQGFDPFGRTVEGTTDKGSNLANATSRLKANVADGTYTSTVSIPVAKISTANYKIKATAVQDSVDVASFTTGKITAIGAVKEVKITGQKGYTPVGGTALPSWYEGETQELTADVYLNTNPDNVKAVLVTWQTDDSYFATTPKQTAKDSSAPLTVLAYAATDKDGNAIWQAKADVAALGATSGPQDYTVSAEAYSDAAATKQLESNESVTQSFTISSGSVTNLAVADESKQIIGSSAAAYDLYYASGKSVGFNVTGTASAAGKMTVSWVPKTDADKGKVLFSATENGTYTESLPATAYAASSINQSVFVRGTAKAEGWIQVTCTPDSGGVSLTKKSSAITVKPNPVASAGAVSLGANPIPASTTTQATWEITAAAGNITEAIGAGGYIDVVFDDENTTGALTFGKTNSSSVAANTIRLTDADYVNGKFVVNNTVAATTIAAATPAKIKVTATAYDSGNNKVGFEVSETSANITTTTSSAITGLTSITATNQTLAMGKDSTVSKLTSSVTGTGLDNVVVKMKWVGTSSGVLSLEDFDGAPIELDAGSSDTYTIPMKRDAQNKITGDIEVTAKAAKAGSGYFEVSAVSGNTTLTAKSPAITVKDYVESLNIAYTGSVNPTNGISTGQVFTVKPTVKIGDFAAITKTSGTAIRGLRITYTWNGGSGRSSVVNGSDGTMTQDVKITKSVDDTTKLATAIGTKSFVASEAGAGGTLTATVQAYSSSNMTGAIGRTDIAAPETLEVGTISENRLTDVVIEAVDPSKTFNVGENYTSANLKARVVESTKNTDPIDHVTVSWSLATSVTDASITGQNNTINDWSTLTSDSDKTFKAIFKTITNPYVNKIIVTATAYDANNNAMGVPVTKEFAVSALKVRELSLNDGAAFDPEKKTIDLIAGKSLKLGISTDTSADLKISDKNSDLTGLDAEHLAYSVTKGSSYLTKQQDNDKTLATFTAASVTRYQEAEISISCASDEASHHALAKDVVVKVGIWPAIAESDELYIKPDKDSVTRGEKVELELLTKSGKEVLGGNNITWSVIKGTNPSAADKDPSRIITTSNVVKDSEGKAKGSLTISSTAIYDGNLLITAEIQNQNAGTKKVVATYPLAVYTPLTGISLSDSPYVDNMKMKVKKTVVWGTDAEYASLPLTLNPAGIKNVVYGASVANPNILTITPVPNSDGENTTGKFTVTTLKKGTTGVTLTAQKNGEVREVNFNIVVEDNDVNFVPSINSINTYKGDSLNLDSAIVANSTIQINTGSGSRDLNEAELKALTYKYTLLEDESDKDLFSVNESTGAVSVLENKAGKAIVRIEANVGDYGSQYKDITINAVKVLESVSIDPASDSIENDTTGGKNSTMLTAETNLESDSNVTYAWSIDSAYTDKASGHIAFGGSETNTDTLTLSSAYDSTESFPINMTMSVKATQTIENVAGTEPAKIEITSAEPFALSIVNGPIVATKTEVYEGKVQKDKAASDYKKIIMTTESRRVLTAKSVPETTSGTMTYAWSVKDKDGKATSSLTLTPNNTASATMRAAAAGEYTVTVKGTQTYTDGTSKTKETEATFDVVVYDAVDEPTVVLSNPNPALPEGTTFNSTDLTVGSSYDVNGRTGNVNVSDLTGYEASIETNNTNRIIDEDGNVEKENAYISISGFDSSKGTGKLEAIDAKSNVEILYTLKLTNENGDTEYEVSTTKKVNVLNKALKSIALSTKEKTLEMKVGEDLVITANPTPEDASNVVYDRAYNTAAENVADEDDYATAYGIGDLSDYISEVASATSIENGKLKLRAVKATAHPIRVRFTAKQNDILDVNGSAPIEYTDYVDITIVDDYVNVESMKIYAGGTYKEDGGKASLGNGADSVMNLSAVLSPSNATDKSVLWAISQSGSFATLTVDPADQTKATLKPFKEGVTGRVYLTAYAPGSSTPLKTTITVDVKEVSLEDAHIAIKGHENETYLDGAVVDADGKIDYVGTQTYSDTISKGTTTLVAVAEPENTTIHHVDWSIVDQTPNEAHAIERIDSGTGNEATFKGNYDNATGEIVRADVYADAETLVATKFFTLYVKRGSFGPSVIILDSDGETIEVGESTQTITASYLPSGADPEKITWSTVYGANGELVELSATTGASITVKGIAKPGDVVMAQSSDVSVSCEPVTVTITVSEKVAQHVGATITKNGNALAKYNGTDGAFYVAASGSTLTLSGTGYTDLTETVPASNKLVKWTASTGTAPATADEGKTYTYTVPTTSSDITLVATSESNPSAKATFTLVPNPELNATDGNTKMTSEPQDKVYTGNAQAQPIALTYRGAALTEGVDYKTAYTNTATNSNNTTDAGTITAVAQKVDSSDFEVVGDAFTQTYKITPASINGVNVALASAGAYDGNAKTPAISTATFNGKDVKSNVAIVANSYKNNVNAGTATATVEGKGNFTGTKNVNFTIAKAASSIVLSATTLNLTGAKPATIGIKSRNGVASLDFKVTKGGTYASVDKNGKVTGKLVGSKKATVQVTGTGDANHNNPAAVNVTITVKKPAKVTNVKPTTTKKHVVTAKWKKSDSATGYIVQISTSKSFTKKTTKTAYVKKASTVKYNFKKCTKGKRYYTRVYAYVGNNKTANRSAVSAKKNVVCK